MLQFHRSCNQIREQIPLYRQKLTSTSSLHLSTLTEEKYRFFLISHLLFIHLLSIIKSLIYIPKVQTALMSQYYCTFH